MADGSIVPFAAGRKCAARMRLEAVKGVAILDRPVDKTPEITAMVFAGIRSLEIRQEAFEGYSVHWYVRLGYGVDGWETIGEGLRLEQAWEVVLCFAERVRPIPQNYSAHNESLEFLALAHVRAIASRMECEA